MIDPKAVTTYAQYNEDLILAALLHDVSEGTYVDVGANYPTIDSVTKYFYKKNWHGINIEPVKSLFEELVKQRPKDINIQCGAGAENTAASLREYTGLPGHSTFSQSQKDDQTRGHVDYEVPIRTLESIFGEYKPAHIHFLKIDVEGYEYEVVAGNNWDKYRPEVICIEANHVDKDWRPILLDKKYKLFIFDGLNEYYIAKESWTRTEGFAERIIKLDYRSLKQHQYQSWAEDSKTLKQLHEAADNYEKTVVKLRNQVAKLDSLSLADKSWPARLKVSIKGLTLDWLRYKKAK